MAQDGPVRLEKTRTDEAGPQVGPRDPAYFRGVASVPVPAPMRSDTGEYAPVGPVQEPVRVAGPRGMPRPSRRGQWKLGIGWTWTGAVVVLVCWGIWAVSQRGSDLVGPLLGLFLVLLTAGLVFTVSRLLGRTVLENVMGRQRHSAWPSHLTTGAFLTMAGIAFLQQTWWVVDAWNWVARALTG